MGTLLTKDIYNNPTEIQSVIIDSVEKKLLSGEYEIADSNSPFIFLLEAACTLSAGAIEHGSNQFPPLYPKRAQIMEDLYKHLSDYDHVELFATPASTSVSLILNKRQLLEKIKPLTVVGDDGTIETTDYYLAQLPKDTYIYFGDYFFGFYYPLNITITKDTELVYINYDTSEINPLYSIDDNNVEFREYTYGLADLIEINLPVKQFQITSSILDCSKVSGLNTKISYSNRLYAVRVYNKVNDSWVPLNVVYSETMYDPAEAAIIAKVYQDTKQCQLTIPQVYFDKGMIGSKLKVDLYTTLGNIDIDISNISETQIKINIPSQLDNPLKSYTEVFTKLETLHVIPHEPLIVGGTNEADFQTIKRRILNRISINGLLVSPGQLKSHYQDLGFSIEHVKDSLEERLYAACGLLTDTDDIPMQVGMFVTEVPLVVPSYAKPHVKENSNSITILPTAIFRYDTELDRAFFITDSEKEQLDNLYNNDPVGFCLHLNQNNYTKIPYHVHILKRNKTPYLTNYDLSRPSVTALRFMKENIRTAEQISIIDYTLSHNCYDKQYIDVNTGIEYKHKYTLNFTTQCTAGIKELLDFNPSDVKALVILKTPSNINLYQLAELELIPETDPYYAPNKFRFNVYFEPNYEFNSKGEINIDILNQEIDTLTGVFTSEYASKAYIPLNCTIKVLFLANYPDILNEVLVEDMNLFSTDYKQLTLQEMDLNLGYNLHNKLYSSVDLVYQRSEDMIDGDDNYIVTETEFEKYPEDIYARNEDNTLIIDIVNDLINPGIVKAPTLKIIEEKQNGIVSCSPFEIVIGNNLEVIDTPTLKVNANNLLGEIESSQFTNTYKGFSQVQAPKLSIVNDAVNGVVYCSPFSVIHGCVGRIKTPHLSVTAKDVEGSIRSSAFEYDVICEIPQINLQKLHSKGDLILGDDGRPIVKYEAGSTRFDLGGDIMVHPREILFMGNMLHVSLNLYYADKNNKDYILRNLCKRAYAQYEKMFGSADRLLENTYVVYKPYTSIGKGTFSTNSSKSIEHDLGISLRFKCYIPEYSLTDTSLQRLIRTKIIEIVEEMLAEGKLSVTEVANQIKDAFSDIIRHVDIFGINGNINLQMIETLDKTKRPIIKQELSLDENRMIVLNKAILVQFVS